MDALEREAKIETLVSPVLQEHGLSLVDLQWRREGRRFVLRFYVDKKSGIGVADSRRFSHEVGDLLDAANLIPDSYDLEVSSPGLTRELRTEREWRWAQGKRVRCWVASPLEGRMELTGRLLEATEGQLRLEDDDGRQCQLERRNVTRARLELDFPRRK